MLVNALSQLPLNPVIVYSTLILYGVLFAFAFAYVRARFDKAGRTLQGLTQEWNSAATTHTGLLQNAHEGIARLAAEPVRPPVIMHPPVTLDTRSQVVAMGKRGCSPSEIARSCGLPEGEVDVLLGLARMQSRN